MDFHEAFEEIDSDGNGRITIKELEAYMKLKNYQKGFVEKWLKLFDMDGDDEITYKEYCDTLGLMPRPRPNQPAMDIEEQPISSKVAVPAKSAAAPKQSQPKKQNPTSTSVTTPSHPISSAKKGNLPIEEQAIPKKQAVFQQASTKTAPAAAPAKTSLDKRKVGGGKKGEKKRTILGLSRSQVFKRKALYRYTENKDKVTAQSTADPAPTSTAKRWPRSYETDLGRRRGVRRTRKSYFSTHNRHLRASLTPGRVLILLVGRHQGKRVILLKALASGYLLVTGPFKFNGVPLRRVHPRSVIATSSSVDVSKVSIPDQLTDAFFSRHSATKRLRQKSFNEKREQHQLFVKNDKDKQYQLSKERKLQQKAVDSQILSTIKALPDKTESLMMRKYLTGRFHLGVKDLPHKMAF